MEWTNLINEVLVTLQGWAEAFFAKLPHLIIALVVVGLSVTVGRWMGQGVHKALSRSKAPAALKNLAERLVNFAVIALAVLIALGLLDLDKPLTSLLAGAGVAGLAIGFAFQHTAANLIAGVTLAFQRPFAVGDLIQVDGAFGTVIGSDLRVTRIRTFQGQIVLVPNKDIIEDRITNFATGRRRIDLEVGVGYESDLDEVLDVTREVLEGLEGRLEGEPIAAWLTGFGGSSIDLICQVWIPSEAQRGFLEVRSDLIRDLKKAYDAHGINIPFPIRTLDFGELEVLPRVELTSDEAEPVAAK